MAVVSAATSWVSKPSQGERVDWSNSLSRGLLFYVVPTRNNIEDHVSGANLTLISGSTLNPSNLYSPGAASGAYLPRRPAHAALTRDVTIATIARIDANPTNYGKFFCIPYNTGGWAVPYGYGFGRNADTSSGQFFYGLDASTPVSISSTTGFLDIGTGVNTFYAVTRSGANVRFYKNGAFYSSATTDTSPHDLGNNNAWHVLGRNYQDPGEGYEGSLELCAVWNRALSDAEIAQFRQNPYRVLGRHRRNFISSISSTTHVLAGTVAGNSSAPSTLTARRKLAGTSSKAATLTGAITARRSFTGAALSSSNASGTITCRRGMTGSVIGAGSTTGDVRILRNLAGAASASASLTGQLSRLHSIAGMCAGIAQGIGSLAARRGMSGTTSPATSVSARLTASRVLSGTVSATGQVTAKLRVLQVLFGTATGSGLASARFGDFGTVVLAGVVSGASSTVGLLTVWRKLDGIISSASAANGSFRRFAGLAAIARSSGYMTGTFNLRRALSGASQGTGSAQGRFGIPRFFEGTALGNSSAVATLLGFVAFPTPAVHVLIAHTEARGIAAKVEERRIIARGQMIDQETPQLTKDPNAREPFEIDWKTWLNGETLLSSIWIVPPGLTFDAPSVTNNDTRAKVFLAGGQIGRTYRVVNRIVASSGRGTDQSFNLTIRER